ncbi:hypothetical protein [Paucibacter soli]|uniref:hypothetical protein n=1 Tax=Paucibacter soli TaxID=3133433 RepID=UPI003098FB9C
MQTPTRTPILTTSDQNFWDSIPHGWFKETALPPHFRNRRFRCERLQLLGLLRTRVVGQYPTVWREWSKLPVEVAQSTDVAE